MINERKPAAESAGKQYYQLPRKPIWPRPNERDLEYVSRLSREYGPGVDYLLDCECVLHFNGIEPSFSATSEQRQRLHSEGGIIFANHPTTVDANIVTQALADKDRKVRQDFLMLVQDSQYTDYVKLFGDKHFLPATRDASKQGSVISKALIHIKNGGVFIIFPSFVSERQPFSRKMIFENGLAFLLAHISPEKMVYTFGINPRDALITTEGEGGKVRVSENYGIAGDWQDLMKKGKTLDQKSKLLAQDFLSLHKNNLNYYHLG